MSFISRLFGRSPPAAVETPAREPEAPVEAQRPEPVARAREEEASLSQAIAAGDMAAVRRWVLEGGSTRIRQSAAQAITDPDQLRELIRATRGGRDKNVYRILTTKRDEQLTELRREQQLRADVAAAAAAIAEHSVRPWDATYAATLRHLETRWRTLPPNATAELQQHVAEQIGRAHEVVEHHRQALEAETDRQRSAARAAEDARRERGLAAQVAAEAAAERARELEAERNAEQAKREADEAAVRHLVGLLRQARAALDHGGTARASRFREAIAEKLPQAPALPVWFASQLEQLDARLNELKDWKAFRVAPKRAELVQQMQSLAGAELSPEELAQRIRRLRDEWRTLNRGTIEEPTPEWEQFEAAAQRAYEPCREHFAQQAELRRENQVKREALIERLSAFAVDQTPENADWRAIQRAVVESWREWRQYAPVDTAVVKPLQARFRALVDDLQARLDAEYARNVESKRDLIARAAALLALEDTRQAIEEAKSLQRTWKTVGVVPRKQDHALWEEFRRHCDAIFERSAHESAAYGAALEANHARAVTMCEELERIAALSGDASTSAAPPLDGLHAEFDALELPRASARGLRQRFQRAAERCAEAVYRERAAAARRGWTDVLATGARVQAYALAVVQEQPADAREALRSIAASTIAALGHAPKAARAVLDDQLGKVTAGEFSMDLAANEAELRLLCVRAELAAGLPTPSEDEELRREYQMQRLVASMGRGERTQPGDLDELALEWIAAGPVEVAIHDALLERFERCRAAGDR